MKDVGVWVILALIGLVVVSGVFLGGVDTTPKLAPQFTLRSLDGVDVSLTQYHGSVVILDFGATWCKPCTKTFPELHALQQDYADRDVVLLLVSLDKSAQRARDHLVENGFATDNVLWGSLEDARAVKALYGVSGIPHTVLIDRAGYIRFSGYPTRLAPEKLEPWL